MRASEMLSRIRGGLGTRAAIGIGAGIGNGIGNGDGIGIMASPLRLPSAALLIPALTLVTACSSNPQAPVDPLDPSEFSWLHGKNSYERVIDGARRHFVLHVPASYTGMTPVPLLFMLHGASGNGDQFHRISRWAERAEVEGFIAVFPTGLEYPIAESGRTVTRWSSDGLQEQVVSGTPIKDDVPFFREVIVLLREHFEIDPDRIYMVGFSNGGGFIRSRAIPEMSDLLAAAASAGGFGLPAPKSIRGPHRIPLLSVIGTLDANIMEAMGTQEEIPFTGSEFTSHPLLGQYLDGMLGTLGLASTFRENPEPPTLNALLFDEALEPGATQFRLMILKGVGHVFPNEINNPHGIVAADLIWSWFEEVRE